MSKLRSAPAECLFGAELPQITPHDQLLHDYAAQACGIFERLSESQTNQVCDWIAAGAVERDGWPLLSRPVGDGSAYAAARRACPDADV